ncbi:MAG: AMP-binding protein [Rhodoblastus sp.]
MPVLEVGTAETSTCDLLRRPAGAPRLGRRPSALLAVRIVKIDADGKYAGDCAPNEIGVVAMAGPGVFTGYMMDEHNKGAFVEPGWVNSGDLGRGRGLSADHRPRQVWSFAAATA